MVAEKKPLPNLQIELLKLFDRQIPDDDLLAIRKMLIDYFAKKSMDLSDEAWDKNNWTKEDEQRFLHEHFRKPNFPRRSALSIK